MASLGADAGPPVFAGGVGSEASPYQIATCAQLQNMETALYSYFVITADIDCTGFDAGDGHGFRPIGTASEEFMGRVNGGEHVITGLHIDRPTQDGVGLFGRIRWAIIKDLGLVSPSIEGHDEVGAFIGRQRWGLLERVFVRDGEVVGNSRVGSMVGLMDLGKIYDSYAQSELTCAAWDGYSGGPPDSWTRPCGQLAGDTIDGIILRSYAAVEAAPHFGLAGGSGTRTHTAAFYDCDLVSGCSAPHAELRTTTQLQSEVYLTGQAWDFTSVWDMSLPAGYACLQWEPGCGVPTCAPDDTTCDRVDDDCDSSVDENFAPSATSCGVGACGATGVTSCVSGSVADSCTPGTPVSGDSTCDGVDQDCDGSNDEAYAPSATSCGVGACGATGVTSCVSGSVADSCTPGTAGPSDASCDGVDQDCDGSNDEAYAPSATSCGVGACGATGVTSCVSGSVADSCTPGTAGPSDATCDGVDQDCDGSTDEAYSSTPTTCGVGECASGGSLLCIAGAPADSCTPGTPASTDGCGGLDDDCDGTVDEDCCVPMTCVDAQATCGSVSDGCGGTLSCGTCLAPEVCGAGGEPNVCGLAALPPDPASIAPAAPQQGLSGTLLEDFSFLFEHDPPVQMGLDTTILDPVTVALVRGCVTERSGDPLAGVRVSLLDRPEHGYTFTRADGCYDLILNGGGRVVLTYSQDNYLPVQREVDVRVGVFAVAPNVTLVRQSDVATRVDFGAPAAAVVVGETQTDADGPRTPAVYFPPGVTASYASGGVTVPLTSGNLRMTEFTVGERGAQAMPGSLPEGTLYTFAMDMSFDEVGPLATVVFSETVYAYVDNFIDLPVATVIPNGHYDYTLGRWVPDTNGVVMRVVGVSGGLAELDMDTVLGADGPTVLASHGVSDVERAEIAARYGVGDSFWRMPMSHFSSVDWNLGGVMKTKPDVGPSPNPDPVTPACENVEEGSVIYCHRRALGENVPVAGTGLALHYQSDRIRGNTLADRTLEIDFTGMTPPSGATALLVHVEVMGRVLSHVRLPVSTERHVVVWDGLDAYGRFWGRPVVADYAVEWIVPITYNTIRMDMGGDSDFGAGGGGCVIGTPCCTGGPRRAVVGAVGTTEARVGELEFDGAYSRIFRSEYRHVFGSHMAEPIGLGGLGLDVYHAYSVPDGRLLLGDGNDIIPREVHSNIFAGGGSDGAVGRSTDGPAARADLDISAFGQVAMGPDETVFFTQTTGFSDEIWSISPSGELEPVLVSAALTPVAWASWGALWTGPIKPLDLTVSHLATDPRGDLYFVDTNPNNQLFRLKRYGRAWRVEHVAGAVNGHLGTPTHWEDRQSSKRSMSILGLAVSSDGTPHVQVSSQTEAGVHLLEITPDFLVRQRDVPRQAAGIAAGQDGAIVVRQTSLQGPGWHFLEVRMDGTSRRLAGGGTRHISLYETYPATELRLNADLFAVGPTGTLYFRDTTVSAVGHQYYFVDSSGMVRRFNTDDLAPPAFSSPSWRAVTGLSPGPGESVLLVQRNANRIVQFTDDLPSSQGIASRDGRQVYIFDGAGMHLRTVDAVNGAVIYQFEHDAERRLTAVVDRDGGRTEFDRVDASTIVVRSPEGPGGARVSTTIHLNEDGYAEEVVDPEDARWSFRYDETTPDAEGLLLEMWAPRSNVPSLRSGPSTTFEYERFARFPGDERGPWVLTRDEGLLGRVVELEVPTTTSTGQPGHRVVVAPTLGTWCDGSTYQVGWTVPVATTTVERRNGTMTTQLVASAGDSTSEQVSIQAPNGRVTSRREPDAAGNGSSTWPGGTYAYHVQPDPLVGAEAPYTNAGTLDIALVSGRAALHLEVAQTRTAALDPLDRVFPYTLVSSTQTTTVNGTRTSTTQYSAATRTYTFTSPEGRVSQRITDTLGRTIQTRSPGQLPTYFDYDALGYLQAVRRGTGPSERRVDYTYDARGYMSGLTARVDATRTTSVEYDEIDARGQARETTVPGIGATMSIEPDIAGAPVSVSPPGQPAHGFEYSIVGQATEYRPPGVAEVPNPADCPAGATCTVYDVERRIDQVVQADGQVLDVTYNAATGQLTSVSIPDDGTYNYSYSPTTGNLDTVTGPAGTSTVQTLWQSDLPIASILTGSVAGRVDVTYNNFLEPATLAVTGGHGVRYTYDRDGLVVSTARVSGPSTAAMTLTRAALDGHVQQDVLGVVTTEYAVDVSATTPGYGDYLGSTVRVSGTPVYESAYEHDSLGRITEWTETVEGSTRVQRFEYDDGGRLVRVRDGMDAPVADYEYDLNGNRQNVVEPGRVLELGANLGCPDGSTPLARAANDRDELCRHGHYEYTYDANGRLQTRVNVTNPLDETVYTYDGGGRLQMVAHGSTTIEYLHDALGRRVGRVVNGAFERGWLYKDSLKPIAQVNAAGDVEATYVYVTRATIPDYIVTSAGVVYRVVADHLGSLRMLVNTITGDVAERYDYDVWGRVTYESGDHSLHPFGYAGGLYDEDTGLVRFGVRDYDADSGRWTAPDPLGFAAEANWYRYAGGDPVDFIDPTGRIVWFAFWVAVVAGGLVNGYFNAQEELLDNEHTHRSVAGAMCTGFIGGAAGTALGIGAVEIGLVSDPQLAGAISGASGAGITESLDYLTGIESGSFSDAAADVGQSTLLGGAAGYAGGGLGGLAMNSSTRGAVPRALEGSGAPVAAFIGETLSAETLAVAQLFYEIGDKN